MEMKPKKFRVSTFDSDLSNLIFFRLFFRIYKLKIGITEPEIYFCQKVTLEFNFTEN